VPRRRILAGTGGLALTAVAVATALVATSENGSVSSTGPDVGQPGPAAAGGTLSAPVGKATLEAAPAKPSSGAASETSAGATELEGPAPSSTGPFASRAGSRDVERGASIVLGAEPSQVRSDAAQVFEAVHAANGIVLRSTIRNGSAGDAGAEFDLLIPSARVGDALAAFSGIGEVRSRHESTQDITAPTVRVGERLQDSQARVQSLLGQLAGAQTEAERAPVEAELRAERRQAAALRSRLSALRRRANLSHVSLRIETGASRAGNSGGWGIGNGFHDAGRILTIAAGIAVISLAILTPLAAIALLAWLAYRAWLRRARRHALGRA
jgi:hypothetical protein